MRDWLGWRYHASSGPGLGSCEFTPNDYYEVYDDLENEYMNDMFVQNGIVYLC
jgi:hypothetical protein